MTAAGTAVVLFKQLTTRGPGRVGTTTRSVYKREFMAFVYICLVLGVRSGGEIIRQVLETQVCISCCLQTLRVLKWKKYLLFHTVCVHGGKTGEVSAVSILSANLNLILRHTILLSQSSCYCLLADLHYERTCQLLKMKQSR